MIKIQLPKNVSYIIKTLNDNGFQAFIVGGCVRDYMLNRTPNDWDVTTNAIPDEIKKLFKKTIDTGIEHGTVTVLIGDKPYEVTTFRKDGDYVDNRRPEFVEYTNDIIQDLSRRDFTVNAMAYNEETGLIDPYNGIEDLHNTVIKCVGNSVVRFSEDALRMLRAVRFSAQLSFFIDNEVIYALKKKATNIRNISAERIRDELNKILKTDYVEKAFDVLHTTTLLKYILPEFDICYDVKQNIKYHLFNVAVHSLKVVEHTPIKLYLRYAALLHDIGKPICKITDENGVDSFRNHAKVSTSLAENILKRIKMDNKNKDKILRLIFYHDREIVPTKKAVKRAVLDVGDDIFLDLINLKKAEVYAQNMKYTLSRLEVYDKIIDIYNEIKSLNEVMNLSSLEINGNDVIQLGYSGKEVGVILNNIFLYIIDNPESNNKEKILKIIKKNANKWLKIN